MSSERGGVILHGYWRSTATYRVRIALGLKGITFAGVAYDLIRGEQRGETYLNVSPQGLVPVIEAEGVKIIQSLAILEWMEERFPEPPLLPKSMTDRAVVRGMADLIACDIHPLNNLRVLQTLKSEFSADDDKVAKWIACWIGDGFSALERLVAQYGGTFCFGDAPTFADCALIPQIYSARRFAVNLSEFPKLLAVDERAAGLQPFATAHPDRQIDAELPAS